MSVVSPSSDSDHVEGLADFFHRFADVNGTRIHYVDGGSGPLTVLLHGWPFTWAEWRLMMPMLVDRGRRVIVPDLRGFGQSAMPDEGYAKADVAKDVLDLVHSLGDQRFDLVGTDIGAMVAYALASRHPDAVRSLVLAETLLPGFGLEELMNPATGGYWHFGFHMQADLAAMLTRGREADYLVPMWRMMSTAPDAEAQARSHYLPWFEQPGAMRAGFQHYRTLLQDGRDNRESSGGPLSMPVLVLSAAAGIPAQQTLDSAQRAASNVENDIVPDAGHSFAHDNPAWVADRLQRFWSKVAR